MNRRNFLKTSMATAVTATVVGTGNVFASTSTSGLIYSARDQGKWQGKDGSHAARINITGSNVDVVTNHGMSAKHYIVRHTLVGADGTVLGSKTYAPTDKPQTTFILPAGYKGKLTATSFCNLHDLWITEITV